MIDEIIEEENESWAQSEKKIQKIINDQLQFERDIEIKLVFRSGKTKTNGAPNKKKTIVAKFLNFKDKQEVLSKYKAPKLWINGILIPVNFFQRAKKLREEGKFTMVVYDSLIVRDRRPSFENAEQ